MTDRELANASVLSHVSQCWVVIKDGRAVAAVTSKEAAKEWCYALGGFGCFYQKVRRVNMPKHYQQ